MNSLHQMESFDANIICFCDLNWCQRHVFFLLSKSSDPSQPGIKNNKINFCAKKSI